MKEKKNKDAPQEQPISGKNLAQMIQMRAQQTLAKPSQKSTAAAGFKAKPETQIKKLNINLTSKEDVQIEEDKSPKNKNTESNHKLKEKNT